MTEWPDDLLGRTDVPRPLPPDVRDRMEVALLAGDRSTELTTSSIDGEVAPSDPIAEALENADRPRPLPPVADRSLEHAFAGRSHRRWMTVLGAVAAAVLLASGLTLAVTDSGRSPSNSASQAPVPTSTHPSPGASGNTNSAASASAGARGASGATAAPGTPSATGQAPQAASSDQAGAPNRPEAVSAPFITAISPGSGPAAGGTAVTLTGRGMESATSVRFGNVSAHFRIVSASQLRAVAPAHPTGTVAVTVTNVARTDFASINPLHFTYH